MKTKSLLAICVINTLVASVHALRPSVAFAAVRPVVTELEFPTYGFSDPDPVPRTESPLYPYFRFDGSTEKSAPRRRGR